MSGKASIPAPPRGKALVPAHATASTITRPPTPNAIPEAASAHAPSKNGTHAEDTIRTRAYFLWEQAGYPESDGVEFWLRAEQELTNSR